MNELTDQHIATIKHAAAKLTGADRRAFQAKVALDYLEGSARRTERTFGWSRATVDLGLNELRTGIVCIGNFSARGNRKTEEKQPLLEEDIRSLAEPQSQQDPKFQSTFLYTRITAKAMRQALIDQKGWKSEELPCEKTIGNILNRLGYRLRRVQKAKPVKKVRETDAIFDNVEQANKASDERHDSLRISIDTKDKVKVGDLSRGGRSRGGRDRFTICARRRRPLPCIVLFVAVLILQESANLVDCIRWNSSVNHGVAVGTDGAKVTNRINFVFAANIGNPRQVMDVNEIACDVPISRDEVEAANDAVISVFIQAQLPRLWITFVDVHGNAIYRTFK